MFRQYRVYDASIPYTVYRALQTYTPENCIVHVRGYEMRRRERVAMHCTCGIARNCANGERSDRCQGWFCWECSLLCAGQRSPANPVNQRRRRGNACDIDKKQNEHERPYDLPLCCFSEGMRTSEVDENLSTTYTCMCVCTSERGD